MNEELIERVAEGLRRYWIKAGSRDKINYRKEAKALLGLHKFSDHPIPYPDCVKGGCKLHPWLL